MGIADYGFNPVTNMSYSYGTQSVLGSATIKSFTVNNVNSGELELPTNGAGLQTQCRSKV